jgi:predicted RNase H-like HicB family nuclease
MSRAQKYSINIQWSDRDRAYIANVPELPGCKTHGDTYKEALNNILEVIEMWIEAAEEAGETIPQPQIIAA